MCPDSSSRAQFFEGADELLREFDAERTPRHVAIIMDGNGRWAQQRGLPRLAGHKAGARAVREVIAASIELGVRYLTIYSFSSENWSRPQDEVKGIMALFVEVLERELSSLEKLAVRVKVIGDTAALPEPTRNAFERCVSRTAANDGLTLVVALNYGARADLVRAVRSLVVAAQDGSLESAAFIDEETVAHALSTVGIPDPDLVIRTSGEMRVSNFLLWEIAYSELLITDTLWPDFARLDMLAAVVEFQSRTRRFGGR